MRCNCKTKCNPCRCGTVEGERLKADAFDLLAERRAVYIRRGQRALLAALQAMDTATVDDVRDLVNVPQGIDPVCLGAVPGPLVRAGIIWRAGYTPTCRPTAHARPLSVWAVVDRDAAMQWLADHPNLPDPGDDGQEPGTQATLFPLNPANEPGAAVAAAAPGVEA